MDELMQILFSSIIYYSVGKPAITNYKLRRDFKLKGVNTSILPTEVTRKVNDIDEKRLLGQRFGSSIIEFANTIKQNIPNADLTLFYNNINNIKTTVKKFKILNLISGESIGAQWVPEKGTIELSKDDYKITINHELLHAVTTFIDPNTGIIFCGFQQIKNNKNLIGEGLNEGYTQYLAEKYFDTPPKAYAYEKRIAEFVELIVGEEKMQSLYFNANLSGLIESLKQYNTEENIYNFITNLDFLNKHLVDKQLTPYSSQIRLNCLKSICLFIIQTFINKVFTEYPDEKIDMNELVDKIKPLLSKLPTNIKVDGKIIATIDDDSFEKIVKEAFSDYRLTKDEKLVSSKKK